MGRPKPLILPSIQAELVKLEGVTRAADLPLTPMATLFLDRLITLLEKHLANPAFGVVELADAFNLSRMTLHRQIKLVAGLAPGELIRSYRLKRATQFLQSGYRSAETAYRVGFDSPSYFSKCFREVYGMSPSEFAGLAQETVKNV